MYYETQMQIIFFIIIII